MRLKNLETVSCDVLVVGGGGAGLRAAIAARLKDADVMMVSKSRIGHSANTYISKAVMAVAGCGEPLDNAGIHQEDTIEGGRFLNDRAMVAAIAGRMGAEASFLKACGVKFGMEGERFKILQVPGHRYPRHLFGENWRGSDLVLPLIHRARELGVRFTEHFFVTRLFSSDGQVAGAAGVTDNGCFLAIRAKTVILATGGYAQIYLNTNNAPGITGDGQALCYDLGVSLKDMEFVQFYPTAMGRRGSHLLLNERLLAQKGVTLENCDGEDIFKRNNISDPMAVTRDLLAQLVIKEINGKKSSQRHVIMNLTGLSPEVAGALAPILPGAYRKGQRAFPVLPTTHFCMGGVATDDRGGTSIAGLFAVGEVAAGAHGANRLGGNALAEIFAMGAVAGETSAALAKKEQFFSIRRQAEDEKKRLEKIGAETGAGPRQLIRDLKNVMWEKAGIVREEGGLKQALAQIGKPTPVVRVRTPYDLIKYLEYKNMTRVAEMVCRAALERTESRGSHFRTDFPEENNHSWIRNIVLRKGVSGMERELTNGI